MGVSSSVSLENEDDDVPGEESKHQDGEYEKYNERRLTYYIQTTVSLESCEKRAIRYVESSAKGLSESEYTRSTLLQKMKSIRRKYDESTLEKLQKFLQWDVPIIIHVHCIKLIPLLMNDTHYRNLFEIGKGSGTNDQKTRANGEDRLFGPSYKKATGNMRPKYGCLNIGLRSGGCSKALSYGDGYFVMNDKTIRWRTTMTIIDSLQSTAVTGTLKYNKHLLMKLDKNELSELIDAALHSKQGDNRQKTYREIQIHGPVKLDRDIISLNVPKCHKSKSRLFREFCEKNGCDLVWF